MKALGLIATIVLCREEDEEKGLLSSGLTALGNSV